MSYDILGHWALGIGHLTVNSQYHSGATEIDMKENNYEI
jgi:hypothetical protein